MKTKRIMPLIIIIALFLTACSGEASTSDDRGNRSEESPASDDGESGSGETSTLGYWESWVKDVPDGPFEKAGRENFALEHNGYSIEITVDKWTGTRGTGEIMLHPANNQKPLPAYESTDYVIPFVLTATTTTRDNSFKTDYRFAAYASSDRASFAGRVDSVSNYSLNDRVYSFNQSSFESQKEMNEATFASRESQQSLDDETIRQLHTSLINVSWQANSLGGNFSGTITGDEQTTLGCYIIKDYYSPNHPDGNADMLSGIGAWMGIVASVAGSDQEIFTLTMLEK